MAGDDGKCAVVEQRPEAEPEDGVPTRLGQAIMLHRAGDREEARNRLAALWQELGPRGDAFHRCALAHYLAGTQDDLRDALDWDLRALAAAEGFVTERPARARPAAAPAGGAPAGGAGPRHPLAALRAFFPALHLNLAADYAGLDRPADAHAQLRRARASVRALADGEHRRRLTAAILRLELRIEGAPGASR
ncbi:hypothetical protein GCM10009864_18820 [Streptomyces lunalinharesii]|uniref:Tetratricopeptide repeat protein n=1 Tax=Streptomyces lunalinharesii TaxID=333384 RepID=A0ABN3RJR7_9ACTN